MSSTGVSYTTCDSIFLECVYIYKQSFRINPNFLYVNVPYRIETLILLI